MQTLRTGADLDVDHIIERVLIRNPGLPNPYSLPSLQLTSHSHLWHFHLQEENLDLKTKIRELKAKFRHKEQHAQRQAELQSEVQALRKQLEDVLAQNGQLQRDINRFRLRNGRDEESIRQSLEESMGRSKSKRDCSCG
jgi:predicted nuclease with TOPRIM domain